MKSLELFARVGGLGLGLHLAGFEPVAAIERGHACCEVLRGTQAGQSSNPTPAKSIFDNTPTPSISFPAGRPPAFLARRKAWRQSGWARYVSRGHPRRARGGAAGLRFRERKGPDAPRFRDYLDHLLRQLERPPRPPASPTASRRMCSMPRISASHSEGTDTMVGFARRSVDRLAPARPDASARGAPFATRSATCPTRKPTPRPRRQPPIIDLARRAHLSRSCGKPAG